MLIFSKYLVLSGFWKKERGKRCFVEDQLGALSCALCVSTDL